MNVEDLDLGDVVYAAHTIFDDGSSILEGDDVAILAEEGSRGVIVMKGYVEEEPGRSVFLVQFEDNDLNLGPPIGCCAEDLMVPEIIL